MGGDLGGRRRTVPSKRLGGGDGDAFVSPKFLQYFIKYKFLQCSHCSHWLLCCVYSSKSCNITWEIAYYFVFYLFRH